MSKILNRLACVRGTYLGVCWSIELFMNKSTHNNSSFQSMYLCFYLEKCHHDKIYQGRCLTWKLICFNRCRFDTLNSWWVARILSVCLQSTRNSSLTLQAEQFGRVLASLHHCLLSCTNNDSLRMRLPLHKGLCTYYYDDLPI